jgi:hypothetical protein
LIAQLLISGNDVSREDDGVKTPNPRSFLPFAFAKSFRLPTKSTATGEVRLEIGQIAHRFGISEKIIAISTDSASPEECQRDVHPVDAVFPRFSAFFPAERTVAAYYLDYQPSNFGLKSNRLEIPRRGVRFKGTVRGG